MWDKGTWQSPEGTCGTKGAQEWICVTSTIVKVEAIPILCWQEILAVL